MHGLKRVGRIDPQEVTTAFIPVAWVRSGAWRFPGANGPGWCKEGKVVLKLSPLDIRTLGFDWPKYSLVEKHLYMEEGKVDLTRTIEGMQTSRAYYRQQLNQAFAFKMNTGADYSDFTDRFDDQARMERELGQAIAYLEEIVRAAGR